MIETLHIFKTRIKLLLKFFLNSNNKAYLQPGIKEFGESSNAIRVELNRFEEAWYVEFVLYPVTENIFRPTQHPLYKEVHNILS